MLGMVIEMFGLPLRSQGHSRVLLSSSMRDWCEKPNLLTKSCGNFSPPGTSEGNNLALDLPRVCSEFFHKKFCGLS